MEQIVEVMKSCCLLVPGEECCSELSSLPRTGHAMLDSTGYNSYCYTERQSGRSPVVPSIFMSLQKVGNNIVRTSKMLDSPKCLVQSMSGKTNNMSICSFGYQFKIAGFTF